MKNIKILLQFFVKIRTKLHTNRFVANMLLLCRWISGRPLHVQNQRDINNIDYWKSNTQIMLDTYLSKPPGVWERESVKDEIMFSLLERTNPRTLLEVGCGFGYTLKKIALRYASCNIFGCDFASNAIELSHDYCVELIPRNQLIVADSSDLSCYSQQHFDVLLTSGCMMCLTTSQVKKALSEFKKISRHILLIEPDYSSLGFFEQLRFIKERNYPISDFRKIIEEDDDLSLIEIDYSLAKETLITNVTFFYIKVNDVNQDN